VIAHIKQIKPANLFLEDILYIYTITEEHPEYICLGEMGKEEMIIMAESEDIHFPMIRNWPCILFFVFSNELFYKRRTYLLTFSVAVLP